MRLENLGFSKSTYGEIILTIRLGEIVNSAPMGVLLYGDTKLCLKVYRSGRTYEMIVGGAEDCVLNVTSDPMLFYNSVFRKDEVSYRPAERASSPRISGCDAYVECSITGLTAYERYVQVLLEPLLVDVTDGTVRVYSRVGPALIEALICYTKLPYLKDSCEEAESLIGRIRIFREIVYHSTRDRVFREIADEILNRSEGMLRQACTSQREA